MHRACALSYGDRFTVVGMSHEHSRMAAIRASLLASLRVATSIRLRHRPAHVGLRETLSLYRRIQGQL